MGDGGDNQRQEKGGRLTQTKFQNVSPTKEGRGSGGGYVDPGSMKSQERRDRVRDGTYTLSSKGPCTVEQPNKSPEDVGCQPDKCYFNYRTFYAVT